MVLKREYDHINSNGATSRMIRRVTVYGSREELYDAIDNLWLEFPDGVFNPVPGGIEIMMFEGGQSEFDLAKRKRADGADGRGDQDPSSGCEREDQEVEGSREERPRDSRTERTGKGSGKCTLRGINKKA